MCFVYKLFVGKFDFVFIDEAQDLNRAQIELALSAVKQDGRVICVMDNFQAIYGFRGADSNMFENIKTRLSPKELMLPICYRCPQKIVELAQTLVSDIAPYDQNKDGEIIELNILDLVNTAKPGDYVISRFNAPVIKSCMKFLKNQIPANILGRDIGDGLSYLIKKSKKKTVKALLEWLIKWEVQEKENRRIKYPNANTESITDKADCIRMLCEDASTIDDVKLNIKNLFQDGDESKIVLHSSIHRVKGKQANNVFVLADTLSESSQEEKNIKYISFTRSMSKLYLVRKTIDVPKPI
jgi:DNA helicase-2/ATP-dependent DNA helicase PcrA